MSENSKHNQVAPATDRIENIFATPAERVKLLRRGIPGKDIEKMYVNVNSILVLGTNWQDECASIPVSLCAVDLRDEVRQ